MIPSITQPNSTIIPPPSSLAGSVFKKLPDSILSMIQNFIPTKEIAANVHLVAHTWKNVWGNDGHLDLSLSNAPDFDLDTYLAENDNFSTSLMMILQGSLKNTKKAVKT